jgi:3',5'-cyclic AMP phosphodiesterase CpdA
MRYNLLILISVFALISPSCEEDIEYSDLKDEKWSFVVFSDVQQGLGVFGRLSDNIGKIEPAPLAAVCCGDIMIPPANEAEWLSFNNAAEPVSKRMSLLLARGNHDGNDPASEACLRQYGHITSQHFYYTHYENDALFIILDTYEAGNTGAIGVEQLSWLKNKLDSASLNPSVNHIFVFMHQPLYPQGKHKGQDLANADEVHEIFISHNKIRAVLSGHDHLFNRFIKDGMTYITTGGGGGRLYKGYKGDYYHFTKVTFYKNSAIVNVKTIDVLNETIDVFDL